MMTICSCLYCSKVTGSYGSTEQREIATVCGECAWQAERSELREVQAGLRPWSRPLTFWANRAGAMPDAEALIAQEFWDAEQREIGRNNLLHWYPEDSSQHAEVVEFIKRNGF